MSSTKTELLCPQCKSSDIYETEGFSCLDKIACTSCGKENKIKSMVIRKVISSKDKAPIKKAGWGFYRRGENIV